MVDTSSHDKFFDPRTFGKRSVGVTGCGALGSKVALSLAKQGVTNLHLRDRDKVEDHNIPGQIFWNSQARERVPKLEAAAHIIQLATDLRPELHSGEVESADAEFCDVEFVCVDRMGRGTKGPGRWEIFQALRNSISTSLVVDVRMGAAEGRIYAFNPQDPRHVARYEATIGRDEEPAEQLGVCNRNPSVGPTGDIITGIAVWQFFKWWRWWQHHFSLDESTSEQVAPPPPEFCLRFMVLPIFQFLPPETLPW